MEIETRFGRISVEEINPCNEILISIRDGSTEEYTWMTMDNAKQLIAHLQKQVDKYGTL